MADFLARGGTQRALAQKFNLALGTITYDVREIERRWQHKAAAEINSWKGRLLAGHNAVIEEAWSEWRRSKQVSEIGDPRFLSVIESTFAEQAKIIGVHAPKEVKVAHDMEVFAARIAADMGLNANDVLAEAERIVASAGVTD